MKARLKIGATVAGLALAMSLFGCGTSESFSGSSSQQSGEAQTIVVGSQDFYENEIIAEAYAEALEANGFEVERSFRIGQREIYMPEIESGSIDVFPEYTGNLLQCLDENATATESKDVYDALVQVMPDGLRVLDQAEATDADSYVATKEFADANGVVSISDLAGIDGLVLAGNSELEYVEVPRPEVREGWSLVQVYGFGINHSEVFTRDMKRQWCLDGFDPIMDLPPNEYLASAHSFGKVVVLNDIAL